MSTREELIAFQNKLEQIGLEVGGCAVLKKGDRHFLIEKPTACICGILNIKTGKLVYANAGHEKPFIRHKDGEFKTADVKSGFVLAGMPGYKYQNFEVQLQPGDTIFTYTDGIPEATNEKDEEFGMERLQKVLNDAKDDSVRLMCRKVRMAVKEFSGKAPQFDDITMLSFKMK